MILLIGAAWSFAEAWDVLYLIYALGDLPDGLGAFIELEFKNVAIFSICVILAAYCARNVFSPAKTPSR